MSAAVWHTNADRSQVGWQGVGGMPFFVQDLEAGTLRLPDLRGMYAEASGFDALDVGGVHGDGISPVFGRVPDVYGRMFFQLPAHSGVRTGGLHL